MWLVTNILFLSTLLLVVWIEVMDSCSSDPPKEKPPPARPRPTTPEPPRFRTIKTTTIPPTTLKPLKAEEVTRTTVARGANVTFQCESVQRPLKISWRRNSQKVNLSSGRHEGGTRRSPFLKVSWATPLDEGTYRCHSFNETTSHVGKHNILAVTDCNPGSYGTFCEKRCGYCLQDLACDTITGNCFECQEGWTPPLCQRLINCTFGLYGEVCEFDCGNCANNRTCNHTNGYCKGCAEGWTPPLCQTRNKDDSVVEAVALGVGIGAPATLGFIAGFLQVLQCLAGGVPGGVPAFGGENTDEEEEQAGQGLLLLSPEQMMQRQKLLEAGLPVDNEGLATTACLPPGTILTAAHTLSSGIPTVLQPGVQPAPGPQKPQRKKKKSMQSPVNSETSTCEETTEDGSISHLDGPSQTSNISSH